MSTDRRSHPENGVDAPREAPGPSRLYRAHGLTIRSELDLPGLQPGTGDPHVTVRYGEAPEHLARPELQAPRAQASPGGYLLRIDGVSAYWVRDGRDVVIDPEPGATAADVRTFFLSSVMGVLVHENGLLALHGSAVVKGRRALLVVGSAGCGKSTVAAELRRRGCEVLSDDICALDRDPSGRLVMHPGYRHLKLWPDALRRLGSRPDAHARIRPGVDKYHVAVEEPASRTDPVPVGGICVLTPAPGSLDEPPRLEPLVGRARTAVLVRETYRFRLLRGLGRERQHLALCQAVARSTPVWRVHRALHPSHIGALADLLEGVALKEATP